jgi:hypothetical protein
MNKSYHRHSLAVAVVLGMVVSVLTSQQSWAAGKGPLQVKPPKAFPLIITQPGSYQLIGNMTVAAATNAIIIQADNVVLDLNGFTATAPLRQASLALLRPRPARAASPSRTVRCMRLRATASAWPAAVIWWPM